MAKKRKLKTPSRRNLVVLALIARKGAGAGRHKSRRREMQVPRKAKYKSLYRPLFFWSCSSVGRAADL